MSEETLHVIPLNDLREHIESRDCWCDPYFEEWLNCVWHNSMDLREEYETGKRKPS